MFLPYFASQGALEDITDVANSLPYKDSLSPAHRKLATYEGKTYALPFTAEGSVLYYNKDLFKKAGITGPADHDGRDPRRREEDPRARPQVLRLRVRRRLRRLQHLRVHAAHLGERR